MIRVVISGSGKMGQEVLRALASEPDMEAVGVTSRSAKAGDTQAMPDGPGVLPVSPDPAALLRDLKPDIVIDFTNAEWTPRLVEAAISAGVRPVIGTSGLSQSAVEDIANACRESHLGGVLASNFAIGAVLAIHLARIAAPFFDHAEIIELHHDQKADAPSGMAITTAREMLAAREQAFRMPQTLKHTMEGSRGAEMDGINIHSVRLQGLVAHQEVIFGGLGQTLTIRNDSTSRDSYMPGVVLAAREVMRRQELVVGLDKLIGLG
jgi:4-hydroxy-tetrahydrodipicolinate reductase